ncbi:hypothetical protein D3C75_953000 [compost metagenome]
MNDLLKELDADQVTNCWSGNIIFDVWQVVGLEAVQEDQERQSVLYCFIFFLSQVLNSDLIFRQVHFLRYPVVTDH